MAMAHHFGDSAHGIATMISRNQVQCAASLPGPGLAVLAAAPQASGGTPLLPDRCQEGLGLALEGALSKSSYLTHSTGRATSLVLGHSRGR